MKITLEVNGREMSFSEQELVAIVKEHLSSEATKRENAAKVAQKPTEGKWFEVKPQSIDQKLFEKEREDMSQERTRKLILEAFAKMKNNPEYNKNFKTMIPQKVRKKFYSVEDLKYMACKLGDHMGDWVEQALEWAQRIANGESWEDICNNKDTANCYRLIVWSREETRVVGGWIKSYNSASDISDYSYKDSHYFFDNFNNTVPLVVAYEK